MYSQSGKTIVVLIVVIVLAGLALYLFNSRSQNVQTSEQILENTRNIENSILTQSNQTYHSQNLDFKIEIPVDAKVQENFTDVTISLPQGRIFQTRVGTNFTNPRAYFENLKDKNGFSYKNYIESVINGRKVVIAEIETESGNQKTYFVYDSNAVYTFYTSDEKLYPVLDQIVQSFEYRP